MANEYTQPGDLEWKCLKCDRHLELKTVTVEYLGNQFTIELPKCPECGMVHVSEELATGKMAEVEQLLEDK